MSIKCTWTSCRVSTTKTKTSDSKLSLGLYSRWRYFSGKILRLWEWDLIMLSGETHLKVQACPVLVQATLVRPIAVIWKLRLLQRCENITYFKLSKIERDSLLKKVTSSHVTSTAAKFFKQRSRTRCSNKQWGATGTGRQSSSLRTFFSSYWLRTTLSKSLWCIL